MRTIEQLNTLLEELEKRIRSISTAQKTLNQINEILAYIQDVQDYLQQLQTTFDSHVQECDDYSNDIANLQTQIDTINQTINNLNTDNETTNQLKTSLSELQTKVDEFIGNSSTTAETLQNDISALQTDLGSCQDDITDIESEISAINSSIGEQNTTITNLQTTQTNLQTTQSSQASTINNINSRLTTAENNISTLTGGVDLSEYESRLSAIEPVNNLFQSFFVRQYNFNNAQPTKRILYTREEHFVCKANTFLYQEFKLSYTATEGGTLTVSILNDYVEEVSYTIDLSTNSSEYTIFRTVCPKTQSNTIVIKMTATEDIIYNSLQLTMHGTDIFVFNNNQDVKAVCFDGEIYISKQTESGLQYGRYTQEDSIDLDNLPNFRSNVDTKGIYYFMQYMPYAKCGSWPYTNFTEKRDNSIIKSLSDGTYSYGCYAETNENYVYSNQNYRGGEIIPCVYNNTLISYISNKTICNMATNLGDAFFNFDNLTIDGVTDWFFTSIVNYNHNTMESAVPASEEVMCVAFANDGNCYLVKNTKTNTHYVKICKNGTYVTAYLQPNGSINVYVSYNNYIDKYNITKTDDLYTSSTYVCTIDDCSCIYEMFNDTIIKKTSSGWVVDMLEF